jgi:hypothetical protein
MISATRFLQGSPRRPSRSWKHNRKISAGLSFLAFGVKEGLTHIPKGTYYNLDIPSL